MAYIDLGDDQQQAPTIPAGGSSTTAAASAGGEEVGTFVRIITSPVVSSALTGLGLWRIARAVDVKPARAAQVGFVAFGLSLYGKLLQEYIARKAAEQAKGGNV